MYAQGMDNWMCLPDCYVSPGHCVTCEVSHRDGALDQQDVLIASCGAVIILISIFLALK